MLKTWHSGELIMYFFFFDISQVLNLSSPEILCWAQETLALQHPIKMGFAALQRGRQAHTCKTKPHFPMEWQIIMVHSFGILKHIFFPPNSEQVVLESRTNNSPSSKHWTFATGELFWKTDSFLFGWFQTKKKPNNLSTDSLTQGQVCVWAEIWRKCRQFGERAV